MLRKIFISIAMLIPILSCASLAIADSAQAAAFTGRSGSGCPSFAGLTSWDCNVGPINSANDIKNGIWTIAANIFTDITVVAAYLVLGYVIYGGYLYTFSEGEPGKVMTAKKTLTQAFIGLAIVMLANVILNTIRVALGANFNADCVNAKCADPGTMATTAVQWIIGVAGIVSAIFIVYGGISYMTSSGDPSKIQRAKSMITYALIGLAVVALAQIITAFVTNTINNAQSLQINNTTIAKEVNLHENQIN